MFSDVALPLYHLPPTPYHWGIGGSALPPTNPAISTWPAVQAGRADTLLHKYRAYRADFIGMPKILPLMRRAISVAGSGF